jgi:antitoxin (DNA-binding transcriptional repressor) of toxin-antitoxin stability system
MTHMKTTEKLISATEFKTKCLKILDGLQPQGIVITKWGQPVAKLTPLRVVDNSKLIGSMNGKVVVKGNIFSAGRKWNVQP